MKDSPGLDDIAHATWLATGMDIAEMRKDCRTLAGRDIRDAFVRIAVEVAGYSRNRVADYLIISPPAACRAINEPQDGSGERFNAILAQLEGTAGDGTTSSVVTYYSLRELAIATCQVCHVNFSDLISERRHRDIVRPRHAFCIAAHVFTRHSAASIGRYLKRDHTTILHACGIGRRSSHKDRHREREIACKIMDQAKVNAARRVPPDFPKESFDELVRKALDDANVPRKVVMPFPPEAESDILSGKHISIVQEDHGYKDGGWEAHKRNHLIGC
jgi:hypothetical protein